MELRSPTSRLLAIATAVVTAGGLAVGGAFPAVSAAPPTLYVGHSAHSAGQPSNCRNPNYPSIKRAVVAASPGSTVVVCPGVYAEDVLIKKSLTLVGDHAVIDASGLENAIWIVHSHVTVRNLTVQNANGEGILVGIDAPGDAVLLPKSRLVSNVLIENVTAVVNDRGVNGTEQGNCKYPGDCGGGIHLNVTRWSRVVDSHVNGNADGILLTDDYGPNYGNVIARNVVNFNTTECGIVLAGHSTQAVTYNKQTYAVTGRTPRRAGLYDNSVIGNVTRGNGTAKAPAQFGGGGSGSGIGVFGSGPGTGAYDNLIAKNVSVGNGLAGFTIHAHLPGGEDVNGNRVLDNVFGTNNLGGDGFDGPPGPADMQTTGIAVYSAPVVHMAIRGNVIRRDAIGIWLSRTVTAHGLADNTYYKVRRHIVRG